MRSITWAAGRWSTYVMKYHEVAQWVFAPMFPVHYETFMRLQWRLRVDCTGNSFYSTPFKRFSGKNQVKLFLGPKWNFWRLNRGQIYRYIFVKHVLVPEHVFWAILRIQFCRLLILAGDQRNKYFYYFFTFIFLLYFFDRLHVRGYCPVVTCSLEITVPALYRVGQIKWHHFTFLLVTN